MAPLTDWPATACAGLVGLFTDIDDTLTTEGAITPDALDALGALKAAGLHVIPITGRPVGWSGASLSSSNQARLGFAKRSTALSLTSTPVSSV